MEVSVVKLSEVKDSDLSFRTDAEFFKKSDLLQLQKLVNYGVKKLKDVTEKIDVGFVGNMTGHYVENSNDPVLLQTKNISEFITSLDDVVHIDKEFHNLLRKSQVYKEDILIARSGSFGKASIWLNDYVVNSSDIIIVKANSNYNPYWIVSFLNSKFGSLQLFRFASGGLQGHVNLTILENLLIPQVSQIFQSKIETLVKSAHAKLELSKSLYTQAENLLLEELGLKDWQPKNNLHTTKKISDFVNSGRLDAEYYQSKYDELFEKLAKMNCKKLCEIVSIKKSFDPGSDAYQETGIPFIRVSDISKDGISETELHLSPIDFDILELKLKKDTILFSKDGSIGIAYKVQSDLNVFTSGALLHLIVTDSKVLPDYLTLVLNSFIVKLQSERDSNGAIIQHWKPSDVEKVVIPLLPESTQTQIANLIQQSFQCKTESKKLLEQAKIMVEEEIEN